MRYFRILILFFLTPIFLYSANLTISSDTTWGAGTYTFNDITITGNSTLTCTGNPTTGLGVTINCDNLTIDAGSKISADSRGYISMTGQGSPATIYDGAGYGGRGGYYSAVGGVAYGSVTNPNQLGSGGSGVAGGGCIIINCTGTVTVNGDIMSNGGNAGGANGGGSGGSIFITTNTLTGLGKIFANGGASGSGYGYGGGGRIAVYFTSNTSTCSFSASTAGGVYCGGAGTIYLKKTGTNGMLIVDNSRYIGESWRWTNDFITTPVGNYTFDTLVIRNKAKVEVPNGETLTVKSIIGDVSDTGVLIVKGTLVIPAIVDLSNISIKIYGSVSATDTLTIGSNCCFYQHNLTPMNFNNFVIQNNGKLFSGQNSASQSYVVNVSAIDITIDSGAEINVNGLGYTTGMGPGVGTGNSGGGYGGRGGQAGGMGGIEYGSIKNPNHIGSGGPSMPGGGFIKLTASNSLIHNGIISANGLSGNSGGSGGGIYLSAGTFTGNGSIYASGGTGVGGWGAGGGGRIAVYYTAYNFTGNIGAFTGGTYFCGGAGTLFKKSSSQTNGDLIIDNNSQLFAGYPVYTYLNEDITIDTLTVVKKGYFVVPEGMTLTIVKGIAGNTDSGTIINKGTINISDNAILTNVTFINDGGIINSPGNLSIGSGCLFTNKSGTVNVPGTLYVLNSGIFEQKGTGSYNNIVIQNGGMLTHLDNSTEKLYVLDISANNVTVDAGGRIDVNGRGYDGNYGPGVGTNYAGGGYGGKGGKHASTSYDAAMTGSIYGSITQPTDIGSGGGISSAPGGGAIKLNVLSTLTINGNIVADGYLLGSGGSVYIIANTISGSGTISANGGVGGGNGSGGGGRIAIYYTTNNFTGSIFCYGGGGGAREIGSSGTIYLKSSVQTYGDLIVDNNGKTPIFGSTDIRSSYSFNNVTLKGKANVLIEQNVEVKIYGNVIGDTDKTKMATLTNKGIITENDTFTFSNLYIINEGGSVNAVNGIAIGDSGILELKSSSVFSVNNINIENGGLLTHSVNTSFKQYFASINTTYFYVKSGGRVSIEGMGYAGTYGSGFGWGVCGGSYGGRGGNGISGASASTYGSSTIPNDLGSGGGGGGGGGQIYIASQYFINDGLISANGMGYPAAPGGRGGGSGGSIYVRSAYFSGNGQFSARGGDGYNANPYSGGGGGGRIAVYYYTSSFTGSYDVNGATVGYDSGYPGTYYTTTAEFYLPPNQPELITPSYGGATTNRRPAFTWVAPTDLEGNNLQFEIEISTDANIGSVATSGSTSDSVAGFEYSGDNGGSWSVYPAEGVSSNASPAVRVRYTVQVDLEDGNYYWRVRAKDVHGYSIWSATGSLPSVTSEFSLRITGPADNTVTYEDNIVIEGWAYQTVSNKLVYNDGDTRDLTLTDNKFVEKVGLAVGANKYTVVVYNKDGAGKVESVRIRRIQLSAKKEVTLTGGVIELEDGDGIAGNNSRVEIESGAIGIKVSIEFKKVSKEQAIYEIKGYEGLLKKRAKICLRYDSGTYRTEEMGRLRIHWWDGLKWQGIATELDKGNEIAISYVNHFSLYSVMVAGEDRARVIEIAPDMITPNNDGINDISSFNVIKEGTFDYEVMIYDVEGRVVRRSEEKGVSGGLLTGWDGRDESGNVVESGLYICVFKIGDKRYVKTISIAK